MKGLRVQMGHRRTNEGPSACSEKTIRTGRGTRPRGSPCLPSATITRGESWIPALGRRVPRSHLQTLSWQAPEPPASCRGPGWSLPPTTRRKCPQSHLTLTSFLPAWFPRRWRAAPGPSWRLLESQKGALLADEHASPQLPRDKQAPAVGPARSLTGFGKSRPHQEGAPVPPALIPGPQP